MPKKTRIDPLDFHREEAVPPFDPLDFHREEARRHLKVLAREADPWESHLAKEALKTLDSAFGG
jgi:hypothetical protein